MGKRKEPMPGILDDTHPGSFYKELYGIVPIAGSKRYAVIGPDKEGTCIYLKTCNTVQSAKKWIDNRKAQ